MEKPTIVLRVLFVLVFAVLRASAQSPTPAGDQATASMALNALAAYPQCESGAEIIKPIVSYLDKDVEASASDQSFWDQIQKIFPSVWDVLSPCVRAAGQSNDPRAAIAVVSLSFVLANLRANTLAFLLKQVSKQHEELRRAAQEYVANNEKYLESQQAYIKRLEMYAQQSQGQQNFLQTLLLLEALSPPTAPTVYVQPAAQPSPTLNLGVHCTVQRTVLGQTFVNCY